MIIENLYDCTYELSFLLDIKQLFSNYDNARGSAYTHLSSILASIAAILSFIPICSYRSNNFSAKWKLIFGESNIWVAINICAVITIAHTIQIHMLME